MDHSQAQDVAAALLERRQQRRTAFGKDADLFTDPAWDTLLLLFANYQVRPTKVVAACGVSNVPKATALRVIGTLEQRGLLRRVHNPRDYRSRLVEITARGLTLVGDALRVGEAGL